MTVLSQWSQEEWINYLNWSNENVAKALRNGTSNEEQERLTKIYTLALKKFIETLTFMDIPDLPIGYAEYLKATRRLSIPSEIRNHAIKWLASKGYTVVTYLDLDCFVTLVADENGTIYRVHTLYMEVAAFVKYYSHFALAEVETAYLTWCRHNKS